MNDTTPFAKVRTAAFYLVIGSGAMAAYQSHFRPTARIFTNVDEHTRLNHGQQSISVELPPGVRFSSFGSCNPQWAAPGMDWNSITIDVEAYDPERMEFRPKAFGGGWLKQEGANGT